jgi:SAM-dependent methyltransferase
MVFRASLLRCYWFLRRIIAPRLRYSQYLYEDVLRGHVQWGVRWLDLGCGRQVLPDWRSAEERELLARPTMVVGLDCDLPSLRGNRSVPLRVCGSLSHLPFRECVFDLATANMVMEHLDRPDEQFQEAHRVLTPGGLLVIHTPNALGYQTLAARLVPRPLRSWLVRLLEGREAVDVFDTYYRANTCGRIQQLATKTGFTVVRTKMLVSDASLSLIPPLAVVELLWIRLLMTNHLRSLRTNIIAVLRKTHSTADEGNREVARRGNSRMASEAERARAVGTNRTPRGG